MHLAALLLSGFLAATADVTDPRAEVPRAEVVEGFEAGDVERIMRLWSERSPTLSADRRRFTRLASDRVELRITAEPHPDGLRVAFSNGEEYVLRFRDGRAWSLVPELPADHPRELFHRGMEHLEAGDFDRALEVFTRADAIAHDAATQLWLGNVYDQRGEPAAAAAHFEKSLALAEAAGNQRATGRALHHLGILDRLSGEYARAAERWTRALAIFRAANDPSLEARMLVNLANTDSSVGSYDAAREKYDAALAIYRSLGDVLGISTVLNNLAIDHRLQGQYSSALELLAEALELSRSIDDQEGVAYALGNMGNVLSIQGRIVDALNAYQESNVINERLGNHEAVSFTLVGIGETYRTLGQTDQAEEHYRKAYAGAEKIGSKELMALALHNVGQVRLQEGDATRALVEYEKSLVIDRELGNRDGISITLRNMGRAYAQLGDTAKAKRAYEESYAIAAELKSSDTMFLSLMHQSELARTAGDRAAELELLQRGMAIARQTLLPEHLWESHAGLGRAFRSAGRLDDARRELMQAVTIVEELRRGIPGDELAQQAFETMVLPYRELVAVLVAQGDHAGALEYAERAKGRALLDVLRHGRPDRSRVLTEAEREQEKQLAAELARRSREYRDALLGGIQDSGVADRRRAARLEYDAFLTALYAAHPQLRIERADIVPVRADDVAAMRGAADVLLEFVVTEEKTYLFSIADALRVHTIDVRGDTLARDVRRFREQLAGREVSYGKSARALYRRLLGPAEEELRGAKTIGIVADGPLWELPFQALQPHEGEFVLDRHAVFYAPSLTVLREMRVPRTRTGVPRLLALGNPVIPNETSRRVRNIYRDVSLAPLPQTETEIRRIAALYGAGNSSVHTRESAREEVVKASAGTFDVLHFATHGVLDDRNAL
ncbi:MAG TPA: tetratricopeptide repeat protein, partial [Thermoanaerobaculia bacterium]|nr:tetratricopeptide repeat protein [Thermoanaerobaculia bacterium]